MPSVRHGPMRPGSREAASAAVLHGAPVAVPTELAPLQANLLGTALRAAGLREASRAHSSDPPYGQCGYPVLRCPPFVSHRAHMIELLHGGSRLLNCPGTGALYVGPNALGRHPGGRIWLILAKASEWTKHPATITRVQLDIERRAFDDEEPEMAEPSQLPPENTHLSHTTKSGCTPGSSATTRRPRSKRHAERSARKGRHVPPGAPCLPASPPSDRCFAREGSLPSGHSGSGEGACPGEGCIPGRCLPARARVHRWVRVCRPWTWRCLPSSVSAPTRRRVLFLALWSKAEQVE